MVTHDSGILLLVSMVYGGFEESVVLCNVILVLVLLVVFTAFGVVVKFRVL